ncbi:YaaC family protein [Alteribacillus iranensis]|uniref:YaaC-like Protein n=1 Tax=Alteribacillus iranensis TaxID=930128 RepID=A0A1I2C634_9BACI|nr:YaaC family protein [Alteribacillus iranensis]SFE63774.1 YaaC-like Protein [Alteribacillus iranensis]
MTNNDISRDFSYFRPYESQEYLRKWLYKKYKNNPDIMSEASERSYTNTSVFHYEWLIGKNYWYEGMNASLMVKPLLLFYGLTHLLKGLVLLHDAYYPTNSEVLAHGVTTRKRKKKGYRFIEDEIKIQKKGFFPHFSYVMFHVELFQGEKWKMKDLLLEVQPTRSLLQNINEDTTFSNTTNKLPLICTHYLLLYNLSMITRYEGEWWGELLTHRHSVDYPIIKSYLSEAPHVIPPFFKSFFS